MKKLLCALVASALLLALAACNSAGASQPGTAASGSGTESTQTFAGISTMNITGHLQHIVVTPAPGDEVVLQWTGDGTETVTAENGRLTLTFAEPDWQDASRDGLSPRFTVVSTIYVQLPAGIDAANFLSNLGDITLENLPPYNTLNAQTVNGSITAGGVTGAVSAETGEGTIGPARFADEIVEQPYDDNQTSKTLHTTIPGAANPAQSTVLYTVLGSITINDET